MAKKTDSKVTNVENSTASAVYFKSVDKGETIYKEWLAEKREVGDLIVFVNVKKEFFNEVLKGEDFDAKYLTLEQFVMDLAKEKEIGKYFHNSKGSAYGAALRLNTPVPVEQQSKGSTYSPDGLLEYKHAEYWMNGKRILDEKDIKKIIHDANFNEKAEVIING